MSSEFTDKVVFLHTYFPTNTVIKYQQTLLQTRINERECDVSCIMSVAKNTVQATAVENVFQNTTTHGIEI